jgi:hypothetical protein
VQIHQRLSTWTPVVTPADDNSLYHNPTYRHVVQRRVDVMQQPGCAPARANYNQPAHSKHDQRMVMISCHFGQHLSLCCPEVVYYSHMLMFSGNEPKPASFKQGTTPVAQKRCRQVMLCIGQHVLLSRSMAQSLSFWTPKTGLCREGAEPQPESLQPTKHHGHCTNCSKLTKSLQNSQLCAHWLTVPACQLSRPCPSPSCTYHPHLRV